MNITKSLVAIGVLAAAVSAPAGATTLNFYTGVTGDLGSSTQSYLAGAVTASTFSLTTMTTVNQPNLYSKNDGAGEKGLGLVNPTQNEIFNPYGIELLLKGVSINSVTIGSVQANESWDVRGWNGTSWIEVGGSPGIGGGSSIGEITVTGLSAYTAILVDTPYANGTNGANQSNNIVLETADVNTVPEPAMLSLMGLGLAGLGFARRRKA